MKKKLINYLTKKLLKSIILEDLISFKGNKVIVGGIEYDEKQARELRNEAQMLSQMMIWKILSTFMKQEAQKQMFNDANSVEDLYFGKATLYTVDIQEKLLKKLTEIK